MLETVLNRESKRKTSAVVSIRNGVRTYGSEAVSMGMRFPKETYAGLKNLLGQKYDAQHAVEFRAAFPNVMIEDPARGTIAFKLDDSTVYSVEELVAMLLAHAKQQAVAHSGIPVSGAVITVPPYFTHFERQAVLDAAEIADLKVFELINDETAAAITYALGKRFDTPKYHVLYDMGAGSTISSLVSFHTTSVLKQGRNRTVLNLDVKAVGSDATLGGNNFDLRLQAHLADLFMEQHKSKLAGASIMDSPRALARLLKEANRVKQILSANQDTFASLENLFEGIDFRAKVTRKDLENLSSDLILRVGKPLNQALASAKLSMADVDSVVLVGGGVRIPAIQAALIKSVGEEKIARNLDGDEAAVHGAVFRGASVSAQFRLGLDMKIKDLNPKAIDVIHEAEPKANVANREITTPLYTTTSTLGSKKQMSFRRITDFSFKVGYNHGQGVFVPIANARISGLSKAVEKFKDSMTAAPSVKVVFELTPSGTLAISSAQATFEIDPALKDKPSSFKDTVLNFFTGGKTDENAKPQDEVSDEIETEKEEEPKADKKKATKSAKGSKANATNETAEATTDGAKKSVIERVPLSVEIEWLTIRPLTKDEKAASRSRLAKMDEEDQKREEREAARNKLESFLYKCKELIWDDETEKYATETELEAFKTGVSETSEWLEDHSETAASSELTGKQTSLQKLRAKFVFRRKEADKRPAAIEEFSAKLAKAVERLEAFRSMVDEDGTALFKPDELKNFQTSLDEDAQWLAETREKQDKLELNQDPVLKSKDLDAKGKTIDMLLMVMNPELRKKPKTASKTTAKTSTFSATATATASSTASTTPESSATATASGDEPASERSEL
eukprot:jgi/Hompol1/4990/HPOL_004075-RA